MNDFTKEELEMLYNMIIHIRNDYPAMLEDDDCTYLKKKIKLMIENYCEHQWEEFASFVRCRKCGYSERTE